MARFAFGTNFIHTFRGPLTKFYRTFGGLVVAHHTTAPPFLVRIYRNTFKPHGAPEEQKTWEGPQKYKNIIPPWHKFSGPTMHYSSVY